MTNAQLIENFAQQLIKRVQYRMESFGDTYEKAKSMIQMESVAGWKCWLIVDQHFGHAAA
jgi:hypothetical protein